MSPRTARQKLARRQLRRFCTLLVATVVGLSYWGLYGWLVRQSHQSPLAPRSIVGVILLYTGVMLMLFWIAILISFCKPLLRF